MATQQQIKRAAIGLRNKVLSPRNKRKIASNLNKYTRNAILERTAKGVFGPRSSGARARRYNERYARETGKSVNGPVNLRLSGAMLDDLYGVMEIGKELIFTYVDFRTADSDIKAEYHYPRGSGRSRIKREFTFLSDAEKREVIRLSTSFLTTHHSQRQPRDAKGRFVKGKPNTHRR